MARPGSPLRVSVSIDADVYPDLAVRLGESKEGRAGGKRRAALLLALANEGLQARIAREADGYAAPSITKSKPPTVADRVTTARPAITTRRPNTPEAISQKINDLHDSKESTETASKPAAPSYDASSELRQGDDEKQAQRGEGAPAGNEGLKARIAREADGYVAPLITNEKSPTAGNSAKIAKSATTTQRPDVQVEIYREINDLRDSKELSETAPRHAAPSYEENSELRRSDDEKQAQGGGGARAAKPWLHLGNL